MLKFRKDLMLSKPIKTLKEVARKLIPPKVINRKGKVEGCKKLDFEEIPKKYL